MTDATTSLASHAVPRGEVPPAPRTARVEASALGDRAYQTIITGFALAIPVLLLLIMLEVAHGAWPVLKQAGLHFFTSTDWDVPNQVFGAGTAIYGTVVSAVVALVIATPLAIT